MGYTLEVFLWMKIEKLNRRPINFGNKKKKGFSHHHNFPYFPKIGFFGGCSTILHGKTYKVLIFFNSLQEAR